MGRRRDGNKSQIESNISSDQPDNEGSGLGGVYGEAGSMLSGSHGPLGWASEIGAASGLSAGMGGASSIAPSSQLTSIQATSANSYNPLASPEDYEPPTTGNFDTNARASSLWTIGPNTGESVSLAGTENGGHQGNSFSSICSASLSRSFIHLRFP